MPAVVAEECQHCGARIRCCDARVAYLERMDRIVAALRSLIAETERCDRPGLYGVSSDDAVMIEARAAVDGKDV